MHRPLKKNSGPRIAHIRFHGLPRWYMHSPLKKTRGLAFRTSDSTGPDSTGPDGVCAQPTKKNSGPRIAHIRFHGLPRWYMHSPLKKLGASHCAHQIPWAPAVVYAQPTKKNSGPRIAHIRFHYSIAARFRTRRGSSLSSRRNKPKRCGSETGVTRPI